MKAYLFFVAFFLLLFGCEKENEYCEIRSEIDYSFKDNDYYFNNWERRNSSFNIGFRHPFDYRIFSYHFIKSTLKKTDTVYFLSNIKNNSNNLFQKEIYKVYLDDSINIIDTIEFPKNIKEVRLQNNNVVDNFGTVILSPDENMMLFSYYIFDKKSINSFTKVLKTQIILYDFINERILSKITYDSDLRTNNLSWSSNQKQVLFYDFNNNEIILLDIDSGEFSSITNTKSYVYPKWGLNDSLVYYIEKHTNLIEINVNNGYKKNIFSTKKYLFKKEEINDFYLLNKSEIYMELSIAYFNNSKLFGSHSDCLLKKCNNTPN